MIKTDIMYWKNGFYDKPQDGCVELTEEYCRELLDGQSNGLTIVDRDGYPVLVKVEPTAEQLRAQRIAQLKGLLSNTDYMAMKVVDGAMTAEEYEPIRMQRAAWRAQINELEIKL